MISLERQDASISTTGRCSAAPLKLSTVAIEKRLRELSNRDTTMSSRYPKRKRADDAGDGNNDGNHKQQNHYSKRPKTSKNPDNKNPYTQRGRLKGANGKNTDEEEQKSINALKNRIRDLSRSLRHVDSNEKNRMPQGIRIERERELESCKHELEEKQTAQREAKFKRDIISKYHMVRFFGRSRHYTNYVLDANQLQNGRKPRELSKSSTNNLLLWIQTPRLRKPTGCVK